jgi:hypothetical protein
LAWIGPLGYVCVCPYSVPTLLLSWFDDLTSALHNFTRTL